MRLQVLSIVLLVLLAGPSGLTAQEDPAQEASAQERTLTGRVIDSDTGTPLLGAFVHLQGEDWGVITDKEGTFTLPRLPDGSISVAVEQLGYVDLVQVMKDTDEVHPVLFALSPDPILLEGIEVLMDRFERRRRGSAHSTQVLDRRDLLASAAFDLVDLIGNRSFLKPYPCPTTEVARTCALVRGRIRPVSVYIDEMPFWAGLDYLRLVQPHELHMVEIFSSRGQVRVYSEGFMEKAGTRPVAVMPLWW